MASDPDRSDRPVVGPEGSQGIFLGLGANLGDPAAQLARALAALSRGGATATARSHLYATRPLGPPQPSYVNAVAELSWAGSPDELLELLLATERSMGRVRLERWGPRTVDLDLLLYGDRVIQTPRLALPHPGLASRAFVLVPLAEIAPRRVHPLIGRSVAELRDELPEQEISGVVRLDRRWPEG